MLPLHRGLQVKPSSPAVIKELLEHVALKEAPINGMAHFVVVYSDGAQYIAHVEGQIGVV